MSAVAASQRSLDLDAMLDDHSVRIVVCCGAGGVGKTTTAAAVALRAAERGRQVVVLTIDPARRLAQSMGLDELGNDPSVVPGVDSATGGRLEAMMLDMKRTFDEIIEAHASASMASQIRQNPFYEAMSTSFSGTQEYMAMEKLGQLRARADAALASGGDGSPGAWDLIVVDTPPSRSALDFLDAPRRLGRFLDGRLIRILASPAKAGGRAYLRALTTVVGGVTGVMTRILGAQVLRDVQTFVAALDSIFGGFRERAERTYALLQQPGTAFVVVATPERDALREASYFVDRLSRERMPLAGLVLNRVHRPGSAELSAERAAAAAEVLAASGEHEVTEALLRLHADAARLASREAALAARFTAAHGDVAVARAWAMPRDVNSLDDLRAVGRMLAGG